jgi:hypothetical protein
MSMATTVNRSKPKLKEQVHELIDQLPDDCTVEDIHYQLYLIEKINRGERSLRKKGGIPHEEVKRRAAKWLTR